MTGCSSRSWSSSQPRGSTRRTEAKRCTRANLAGRGRPPAGIPCPGHIAALSCCCPGGGPIVPNMRIGVLGTTAAADGAGPVNLGGPKQRALLAALALHRGRTVAADTLADLIWNGSPPPGVSGTMQGYVAGLRRALEPGRTTRGSGTLLVTEQPGYALRLPDEDLDAAAFENAVSRAHGEVAPLASALCHGRALPAGSPDAAGLDELHRALEGALALWRGAPLADLGDVPAAEA